MFLVWHHFKEELGFFLLLDMMIDFMNTKNMKLITIKFCGDLLEH